MIFINEIVFVSSVNVNQKHLLQLITALKVYVYSTHSSQGQTIQLHKNQTIYVLSPLILARKYCLAPLS